VQFTHPHHYPPKNHMGYSPAPNAKRSTNLQKKELQSGKSAMVSEKNVKGENPVGEAQEKKWPRKLDPGNTGERKASGEGTVRRETGQEGAGIVEKAGAGRDRSSLANGKTSIPGGKAKTDECPRQTFIGPHKKRGGPSKTTFEEDYTAGEVKLYLRKGRKEGDLQGKLIGPPLQYCQEPSLLVRMLERWGLVVRHEGQRHIGEGGIAPHESATVRGGVMAQIIRTSVKVRR